MRLHELNLTNFQGVRSLRISPNGESFTIYGDNGTGKTTVFNAITWLLFNRSGEDIKNYTPKTRTANGEAHNLEHIAEGVFSASDGARVTLRKIFREVYKKKNGGAESEFSGHTTDFYVDGVPVKEKEYTETVARIIGGDMEISKILTIPTYFPAALNWETRRKILVDMCGVISDDDIISRNPELAELPEILTVPGTDRRYSAEDYIKIASSKKTEINKCLATLPARIDEATKALPEVMDVNAVAIKERIGKIDECIRDLERRKSATEATDKTAELRAKLNEVKSVLQERKAEHMRAENKKLEESTEELKDAQIKSRDLIRQYTRYDSELTTARREKEGLEKLRADLIAEYNKVSAMVFDETATMCPTCGQAIPVEKIDEMREEFNLKKSLDLSAINARGKKEASKEMIASAERKIAELEKEITDVKSRYDQTSKRVTEFSAQAYQPIKFESTEEYEQAHNEIERIEAQILDISRTPDTVISGIERQISELYVSRSNEQEKLVKLEALQAQTKRIHELESEEKRLGAEFAEIERRLYLCDKFIRAKVSALDENINSRFDNVKFKLFSEQINGGIKAECEVMIPAPSGQMVPYAFANNAARINAGLEIIDSLSKHYGISLPVIVDNAESVTSLLQIDAQTIRLVVSESDKELRVS